MQRLVVCGLLILGGCASDKYVKEGASNEERERALAGCRVQAATVPNTGNGSAGDNMFHTAMVMQTVQNCMRAQGWVKE